MNATNGTPLWLIAAVPYDPNADWLADSDPLCRVQVRPFELVREYSAPFVYGSRMLPPRMPENTMTRSVPMPKMTGSSISPSHFKIRIGGDVGLPRRSRIRVHKALPSPLGWVQMTCASAPNRWIEGWRTESS